jgi:CheY-like chemotaxis protein
MCKLIVIDDNPTDHYIIQRLLHDNYNCQQTTYVFNAGLVLDYLKENKNTEALLPDLIFLDLEMPGVNGWEFLDEFERLKINRKDMQVHIMSSSIRSADVFRSKKYASVNSFMAKPLSKEVVNRLCEQAATRSAKRRMKIA